MGARDNLLNCSGGKLIRLDPTRRNLDGPMSADDF
jgi:hypothetical protein